MITPPPNYKLISYKEWGGRFLPKEYRWFANGCWNKDSLGVRSAQWDNPDAIIAIPSNHVPRKTLRENKKILNAVAEFESAIKGAPLGKMRAIGEEGFRKTNYAIYFDPAYNIEE